MLKSSRLDSGTVQALNCNETPKEMHSLSLSHQSNSTRKESYHISKVYPKTQPDLLKDTNYFKGGCCFFGAYVSRNRISEFSWFSSVLVNSFSRICVIDSVWAQNCGSINDDLFQMIFFFFWLLCDSNCELTQIRSIFLVLLPNSLMEY